MNDYLQPVHAVIRCIAALFCLAASCIAAITTAFVVVTMIHAGRIVDAQGRPVWLGFIVCGLLALSTGWMSVRLWKGNSPNGVTVLPVWFIEVFGGLFLIATIFLGVKNNVLLGSLTGLSVALAMLLVRFGVRRRMGPTNSTTTTWSSRG
jgi:hypothetical protein